MGGDEPQKGGKKGVKVCIDKSRTKKGKQKKFEVSGKYKVKPKSDPDPKQGAGLPMNQGIDVKRGDSGTGGYYTPQTESGTTVPVDVKKAIKFEKQTTKLRKMIEEQKQKDAKKQVKLKVKLQKKDL